MSRCNVILFITTFRQLINNRTGHLNNINYNKYNTGKIKKITERETQRVWTNFFPEIFCP